MPRGPKGEKRPADVIGTPRRDRNNKKVAHLGRLSSRSLSEIIA
jgi:hypothetical protein